MLEKIRVERIKGKHMRWKDDVKIQAKLKIILQIYFDKQRINSFKSLQRKKKLVIIYGEIWARQTVAISMQSRRMHNKFSFMKIS